MAVTAATTDAQALLQAINDAISNGKIDTWKSVQSKYLTHSPDQWRGQAFFLPKLQYGALVFNIVPPKGQSISTEIYAIYHGRLIEMLLAISIRALRRLLPPPCQSVATSSRQPAAVPSAMGLLAALVATRDRLKSICRSRFTCRFASEVKPSVR